MIVLLLVILAIVYKMMNSIKFQSQLTVGIAKKAGVPIPKIPTSLFERKPKKQEEEEQETEDVEYEEETEEEETEEQEQSQEEETEEEQEQREEEENQDNSEEVDARKGKDKMRYANESKATDLEPRNHLRVVTPPKSETETNTPKKKLPKKSKLKGYEMVSQLLDTPLNAGDLKEKFKETFGDTPDGKIVYNLNYAITLNLVKKHQIGKRFLYAKSEMFEGDTLKQEFLPKETSQENTEG